MEVSGLSGWRRIADRLHLPGVAREEQSASSMEPVSDTSTPGTEFASLVERFLGSSGASTVNEEELFSSTIHARLETRSTEAARYYAEEKAKLMVSMARSDGYIPVEDVAKAALRATVDSGQIDRGVADMINAEAFAAAQLDSYADMLFDGRGNTSATADRASALAAVDRVMVKVESGEMKLEPRSIDILSNQGMLGPDKLASSMLEESAGASEERSEEPVESSADQPPSAVDVNSMRDGKGGFFWEPRSDRDGKLAILLPAELGLHAESIEIHSRNPTDERSKLAEGRSTGTTEDGRSIFRFDRTGDEYGDNIFVILRRTDGERTVWEVDKGGEEND